MAVQAPGGPILCSRKDGLAMSDYTQLPLEGLLQEGGFDCPYCGKHHSTGLKHLRVGSGVIREIPEVLERIGVKKPFVICDINTWKAAAEQVTGILQEAGLEYSLYRFDEEELDPDEHALGCLAMNFDAGCDIIMAVGSGVLNDLSKCLGHVANLPTIVVGTAPSMDGYASNSSSMLVAGVKSTLYNKCPVAVIADIDIMAKAPMRMLQSGFGDVVAKYVSTCEWRISHLVTGEFYCEGIASIVRRSLAKMVATADKLTQRDPETVGAVVEGLILTGIAMSFAECSRPASGLEHYFSHIWDMMCLDRHITPDLHGIQCGIGTVLTIRLYQWLRQVQPDKARALESVAHFDVQAWEQHVKKVFGQTAPNVFAIEDKVHKNSPEKHAKRLDVIIEHWDEILRIIDEELPDAETFENIMKSADMPMLPRDLSFTCGPQDVKDALRGARDIRDKYLGCTLMWDLGLLEEAVEEHVLKCAEME